jgi:hypothetical protein
VAHRRKTSLRIAEVPAYVHQSSKPDAWREEMAEEATFPVAIVTG